MPHSPPDIAPDSHISYSEAVNYWSSVPATVDGVLGGFGSSVIPKVDIIGSNAFLHQLYKMASSFGSTPQQERYAVDIGAGIGRVTKNLLSKHAYKVDLVDPVQKFVEEAKRSLEQEISNGLIGQYYTTGMQDFEPERSKYWLIWCQWCVGHLPDAKLVEFFQRCAAGLQPGGIIVVKENNSPDEDQYDDVDSSVTRTDGKFKVLFEQADLELIYSKRQPSMPKEVFPVTMYALRPKSRDTTV